MDEDKGKIGMAVVIGWLGIDRKRQDPSSRRGGFSCRGARGGEQSGDAGEECEPTEPAHAGWPASRRGDVFIRH